MRKTGKIREGSTSTRQSVRVVQDTPPPEPVLDPREVAELVLDRGGLLACRVKGHAACTAYTLSGGKTLGDLPRYMWTDIHRTLRKGSSLSTLLFTTIRSAVEDAMAAGFEVRWFEDLDHLLSEWPDVKKFGDC